MLPRIHLTPRIWLNAPTLAESVGNFPGVLDRSPLFPNKNRQTVIHFTLPPGYGSYIYGASKAAGRLSERGGNEWRSNSLKTSFPTN